jgi:hypothetical protein
MKGTNKTETVFVKLEQISMRESIQIDAFIYTTHTHNLLYAANTAKIQKNSSLMQ